MKSLKFVQIGDVHYPEAASTLLADWKDKGIPRKLVQIAAANKLQNVSREVVRLCENDQRICGLLFCGDLTTGGDITG